MGLPPAPLAGASLEPDAMTAAERRGVKALRESALSRLQLEDAEDASPTVGELLAPEALLRFHRARRSVQASTDMLVRSAAWREDIDIFAKIGQWRAEVAAGDADAEALLDVWPSGVCGVDRRGVPVFYGRYGEADMHAIVKQAGMDRIIRCSLAEQRDIEDGLDAASVAAGCHLVQVICVCDLGGLELGRARRSLRHFMSLQALLDANFPERLHVAFVVNAPWVFGQLYKLVRPLLAEDTQRKVRILSKGGDHTKALEEFVPRDQIPQFLGGDHPWRASRVGPEPRREAEAAAGPARAEPAPGKARGREERRACLQPCARGPVRVAPDAVAVLEGPDAARQTTWQCVVPESVAVR